MIWSPSRRRPMRQNREQVRSAAEGAPALPGSGPVPEDDGARVAAELEQLFRRARTVSPGAPVAGARPTV